MKNLKKVRKHPQGGYPVWIVESKDPIFALEYGRFTSKKDADDFILRRGGYLCWEVFSTREEAQAYYEEKPITPWW